MTQDPPWPKEYVVKAPAAVRTLLDLKALRFIGPFLHGPRTLSEAAGELERSTSSVAYWISKLEAVGLITRLTPVKRNGMPMPRYRAAGQQLFLPFSAVPPGITSDLLDGGRKRILDRFLDAMDEVLRKAGHTGLEFKPSGPKGTEIDLREPKGHEPTVPWTDFWGTLSLTREQACDFSDELKTLVNRYREMESGRGEYVMHAGIAPDAKLRTRSR